MNMRLPIDTAAVLDVPTLVLIHDAHGSALEFDPLVQILGSRGVSCDFLEIPGYTHQLARPTSDWRAWLRAAGDGLDRRHGAAARIVLGGFGTGAALAAALALQQRRQAICGVALLSPTFARVSSTTTDSGWLRIASMLGLDRWIPVAQCEPYGIKNPKTRKWIARELEERRISSIGPAQRPLRSLHESDRLHAHVRPRLAELSSPLLVLHASADELAPIASVAELIAPLGDRARLIALEHSHHRITVDNDRQRVAHELADFAGAPKRATIGAAPSRRDKQASRVDCKAA